jgi:hypothetical protein
MRTLYGTKDHYLAKFQAATAASVRKRLLTTEGAAMFDTWPQGHAF